MKNLQPCVWTKFRNRYVERVRAALEPWQLAELARGVSEHEFYDAHESTIGAFLEVFNREPLFLKNRESKMAQEELTSIHTALEGAYGVLRNG